MASYNKLKSVHIREQIDELRGKLSLKKRDNAAIFQSQQDTIKKNEEKILNLRRHVKEARQDLAKALNKDTSVIKSALEGQREKQLECKRYDAHTANKELDEDVCVLRKRLNHFVHQKECRNRRLNDLKFQYRDFMLLEHANFEQEDQKRVRMLSTKLDKMTLKRNTASFINRTYKKTLSKLNKDALYMPNTIDQFEVDVKSTAAELVDLQQIHQVAQKGQESSRARRIAVERDFYNGKHQRDKQLTETRKRTKDNSEMPDIEVKKTYNDVMNGRKQSDNKRKDAPSELLSRMEPVIKLFSAITNTGLANEIPEAYQHQIENYDHLTHLSQEYLKRLEERNAKHKELQDALEKANYQQTQQTLDAEQKLKDLAAAVDKIELERIRNANERRGVVSLIDDVRHGVLTLAEKLNKLIIKKAPPVADMSSEPLEAQVKFIVEKISGIKEAVREPNSIGSCSIDPDSDEDPLEHLIKLNAKNCRITVDNQEDDNHTDTFLIDDAIMNEQYRTYEEVKGGTQKTNRRKR